MISSLGIVDTKKIIAAVDVAFNLNLADYSLTTLRRRFMHLLNYFNINSVDAFVESIKNNNIGFDEFMDQLLVDTTELFRDPSLWRELREKYIYEVGKSSGSKIWMAGISSGEELYSLMVLLHEAEMQDQIRVVASCPSVRRIERIKMGWGYDMKKMEIGEANYTRFSGKFAFSKYFKIENNKAYMDTDLLKGVEFNTMNVSQEASVKTYRMIVFRNMMIQYNLPLYEKTAQKLIKSLTIGGYLLLGNKESLEHSEVGKKMQLVNDDEKIYRKRVD